MITEKQTPRPSRGVCAHERNDYCVVMHVPQAVVVIAALIPQRTPVESTHQKLEVVEATAAGRATLTAKAELLEVQVAEPGEPESTSADAIAFSIVVLVKRFPVPVVGQAARAKVPYVLLLSER